jgi:hypothetical protein
MSYQIEGSSSMLWTTELVECLGFSPVVGIGPPPTPHPQASVPPPPPALGGGRPLAGERGVGRVPILTRGHTLWYSFYIRTLCSGQSDTSIGMVNMINIPVASPAIRDTVVCSRLCIMHTYLYKIHARILVYSAVNAVA